MTNLTRLVETNQLHAKLTRSFLEELPEGCILMSNVCSDIIVPSFFEKVSPADMREEQWQRIKAVGADNRMCRVFKGSRFHEKLLSVLEDDNA